MRDITSEFLEENEDLVDSGFLTRVVNSVRFVVPSTQIEVFLNASDIKNLRERSLPEHIRKFRYHEHYGFSIDTYGEYFIGPGAEVYSYYELYGDYRGVYIAFDIGDVRYELSEVSQSCHLLVEPFLKRYDYSIADRGLDEYFLTLKIHECPPNRHKEAVIKALYYLNTSWIGKDIKSLSVFHIFPKDFDFTNAEYKDPSDDVGPEKSYTMSRPVTKHDLQTTEPLYFFVHGKALDGTERFLMFYRVLEYFFTRALEHRIDKIRFKSSVGSLELMREISLKDEREKLGNLIEILVSSKERNGMIAAHNAQLQGQSPIASILSLSDDLYDYRCSIVHSKEEEILSSHIPDIFAQRKESRYFEKLVESLAERSINKFNRIKRKISRMEKNDSQQNS